MDTQSKYKAAEAESKWYKYWMKHNYFHSEVDNREPFTIVIPPPNITGVLHMGHMLNNTVQDVLVRKARMQGKNTCWIPGIDHASIATEAKVVALLKKQGISKDKLTRKEFLKHAWQWKNQYGKIILEQLKKLGASCDWQRTTFTMDPSFYRSVIKVFVDLYNKGYIYRAYRMVNWDPEAKTTVSNEEVIYKESQTQLYYLQYKLVNSDKKVTVATTRPETILGDTAICINPNDHRFKHLKGQQALVPICNRKIPIIEDTYVDMDFGTGCLKITPAHDENDKILADKHHLDIIDIFNEDATLNDFGLHYRGKDRFVVRKEIVKELKEKGVLIKIEKHTNKLGISERTQAVIEPRLSQQWFLKMKKIAKPAIEAVLGNKKEVKLFPKKFENTYRHWMENIRDWNISRQLWWGHQIPAYYYGDTKDDFVVAQNIEIALEIAKKKTKNPNLSTQDLRQDPDTLDTWFSSWLWPISVFDGILNPQNNEINYYYPSNDLVTGPDILFFWVARMIVAGYQFKGEVPFKNVYLTGLVRDKQGRKMSKSLGNSPDALKLIKNYSADGVRVGLLLSSAAGNDLLFDEALCNQGRKFGNKIWSAFTLTKLLKVSESSSQPQLCKLALSWYEAKFQKTLAEIEDNYSKYRLSQVVMAIYKLIYDDFCGWLLEIVKPEYSQPIDAKTYRQIIVLFEDNLKILHPFMPFISEEIWQSIQIRTPKEALIIAKYPQLSQYNAGLIADFDFATEVISKIRNLRKEKNISFKDSLNLTVINNERVSKKFDELIKKLGNITQINYTEKKIKGVITFRVKLNEYFIPIDANELCTQEDIKELMEELNYTEGFLKSVQSKLSNRAFVSKAPKQVVEIERKKESDALAKIKTIKNNLKELE
ncbi:MAG: valine--tRNA ligase [Tenacibaculum sp.]